MQLTFLGATMGVTGSCFLVEAGERKMLVDCGMFQGSKIMTAFNRRPFAVEPGLIDCVLLTHAHIDHSGLLPKLCKEGFRGPIYATKATIELCSIMLPDSAHIQEFDAEIETRKGKRAGRPVTEPLYTVDEAYSCLKQFRPVEYETDFNPVPEVAVRYHDAGHILGSSMLALTDKETGLRVLFSGDLGRPNQPILQDPTCVQAADYLVMESTYGDRDHVDTDWDSRLAEIINETVERRGNVVIPAFAVGRTQVILYYLNRLHKAGRIPNIPVIIDSPLAIAATDIFRRSVKFFDKEATDILKSEGDPLSLPQLQMSRTAEESRQINFLDEPAIIISASGMADAGRILHHLKHNLWRPESSVLFVGFQAQGSLGRRIIDGAKKVRIMGEEIGVKAHIYNLDGLSAHADRDEMMKWLECFQTKPANIFLVHGEPASAQALEGILAEKMQLSSYTPRYGDTAVLQGRTWQIIPSRIVPIEPAVKALQDLLNEMDAGFTEYRQRLEQMVAADASRMPAVLDRLGKIRRFIGKTLSDL